MNIVIDVYIAVYTPNSFHNTMRYHEKTYTYFNWNNCIHTVALMHFLYPPPTITNTTFTELYFHHPVSCFDIGINIKLKINYSHKIMLEICPNAQNICEFINFPKLICTDYHVSWNVTTWCRKRLLLS